MASMVAQPSLPTPLLVSEKRGNRDSQPLRKAEIDEWQVRVGAAIRRARLAVGWSLKEFAAALEQATEKSRDDRQISRWEDGKENPQLAALFSIERLRGPLVIQLATLAQEIEVVTEIRVRG